METEKTKHSIWWLILILVLGLALRFYELGTESYWIDEMSTVLEGQQSIPRILSSGRLDQPPGYYLPFHFWEKIFGPGEVATRSFSALIGIASIFLLFLVGRLLFGEAVGLMSAFFMAISQLQVYHSQIARFYGFFQFTALLSFLFFILALRDRKRIHFLLYGIAGVLMLYSNPFGIFILAAQNLFFILQVKRYGKVIMTWLVSQLVIVFSFAPYFYPLAFGESRLGGAVSANIGNLSAPSVVDPFRSVYLFLLSARRDRDWKPILINYAVAGIFLLAGFLVYRLWRAKGRGVAAVGREAADLRPGPEVKNKLLLISCWLFCPIILPFIFSILFIPIYQDYYTISAAPAAYLLLAAALFTARKRLPLIISLGTLLIMIVPGLGNYYIEDINAPWEKVAGYVEANSKPNDAIVFAPNEGSRNIQQTTFNWYYEGSLPGCGLTKEVKDMRENLLQCISGHDRFWVIMNATPEIIDRFQSFILHGIQDGMVLIKEKTFMKIYVYLYEIKKRKG